MGSDRLRMEDIEARQSSLLTTHGLRLVAVSPLPGEIVVAVARPQRQTVSLWHVWARRELNRNSAGLNTSFVLGLRELDGEILYLNLGSAFGGAPQHEPHTLVAGATGSGKSVLIQALILDIAATNSSSLAQIYLIDPKMGVDYSAIERPRTSKVGSSSIRAARPTSWSDWLPKWSAAMSCSGPRAYGTCVHSTLQLRQPNACRCSFSFMTNLRNGC